MLLLKIIYQCLKVLRNIDIESDITTNKGTAVDINEDIHVVVLTSVVLIIILLSNIMMIIILNHLQTNLTWISKLSLNQ